MPKAHPFDVIDPEFQAYIKRYLHGEFSHHSFALTFLPDSSSASASAYSSSSCFLYILAVGGRFIFKLIALRQHGNPFAIQNTVFQTHVGVKSSFSIVKGSTIK